VLPFLVLVVAAPASANSRPVCRDAQVTVEAGRSVVVTADCSDADGEAVHPVLGSDVQHGSLSMTGSGDGWTYRPDPGYGGPDSFQYVGMTKLSGATPDDVSAPATVSITVTAPPVQPVGDADGDGIPDNKDTCRTVAGTADFDGCPPDSDGDGIVDTKDECPNADQGQEGARGCTAPWRPALKVASTRAAHAIERALRNPALRARFKSTGRLPVTVRLPAGLPHHRWFIVEVIPLGVPPAPESTPSGRTRCEPGHRCRVVLEIDPKYLYLLRNPRVRRKGFACATSMWRRGHAADAELTRVRLIGITPG
jgi:hypothetical protein